MAQKEELNLEQALAKIAEQATTITTLEGEVNTSTALISELNEQLENATAGQEVSAVVVVTHERVQYRVLAAKFQHKGKEYLAKELNKHADVVAELVEAESGLLHKIEKKK